MTTSAKPYRLASSYRDRIYIIKDIILKLGEYGELNQTNLLSFCGLNPVKHRDILDDMERKGILTRTEERRGNKTVIIYRVTEKGKQFCEMILEPYERMFPRKRKSYNKVTEDI
jgi:predicted transcriptional regulator